MIFLLGVWFTPLREWVADLFGGRLTAGRVDPTIFLSLLSMALLGLLVWSTVAYFRLLRRVRDDKLTLGDLMSIKDMMKATDIEAMIRKRQENVRRGESDS